MLEVKWSQRRSVGLESIELGDDSMVDILAEQVRLMDIWINDMEISVKLIEEKAFVADEDEETWTGCVYVYAEKMAGTGKDENMLGDEFGFSNGLGIGNNLANESAYHYGGTWYLDRWIPGTGIIMINDQECPGSDRECAAKLSGTVLTNIRIIRTQDLKASQYG